jgi:hypothetical protein
LPVLIGWLLSLAACGSGEPCDTTILDEQVSPDGLYVAAVMQRVCDAAAVGAVAGVDHAFLKAVLMRHADEDGYGDDPLAGALHIVDGDWPLTVRWIDPGWFAISSDNPPDKLIRWSARYEGGIVVYE